MEKQNEVERVHDIVVLDEFLEMESTKAVKPYLEKRDEAWKIMEVVHDLNKDLQNEASAGVRATPANKRGEPQGILRTEVPDREWNQRFTKKLQEKHPQAKIPSFSWDAAKSKTPIDRLTFAKEEFLHRQHQVSENQVTLLHCWRELGLIYESDKDTYSKLPYLGARYLMDGFPFEVLDGDSGYSLKDWLEAVLQKAYELMTHGFKSQTKVKIFVLSILGVQSTGKSTLLNTMFGVRFRTSVGRCTRGVQMQIIPSQLGSENADYDYLIVLDTEGVRSPEFANEHQAVWRDNRMGILSVFPADACILLIDAEHDEAIKEILPVTVAVHRATRGDDGELRTKFFFCYNRVRKDQEEAMKDQIIKRALLFLKTPEDPQDQDLFTSAFGNVSERDFITLCTMTEGSVPRVNPDFSFGKGVLNFRKQIHDQSRGRGAYNNGISVKKKDNQVPAFDMSEFIMRLRITNNSSDSDLLYIPNLSEYRNRELLRNTIAKVRNDASFAYGVC